MTENTAPEPESTKGQHVMRAKLGCQARPWLVSGVALPEAISQVGEAGYGGIELGFGFVNQLDPRELADQVESAGLELAAIHYAPGWGKADVPARISDEWERLVAFGPDGHAPLVVTSSGHADEFRGRGADALARAANAQLRIFAGRLEAEGGGLMYHNHGWEFARPGVFDILTDGLDLAVDLAHLVRAGQDVGDCLQRWGGRVQYLHARDVAGGHWMPALGHGGLPLSDWVRSTVPSLRWCVVEAEPDPEFPELWEEWGRRSLLDYAVESRRYLEAGLGA